jgi:hypothetical protein
MTDAGRKDMGDSESPLPSSPSRNIDADSNLTEIQDKITPNSQKSTVDKVGDSLSGTADKAQRDIIPDSQKSGTQSAQDKLSREKDSKKDTSGESLIDKAKSAVGMDKK